MDTTKPVIESLTNEPEFPELLIWQRTENSFPEQALYIRTCFKTGSPDLYAEKIFEIQQEDQLIKIDLTTIETLHKELTRMKSLILNLPKAKRK